jgi:hypothetical protein
VTEVQIALFLMMLVPLTLALWVETLAIAGAVPEIAKMPWEFRLVLRIAGEPKVIEGPAFLAAAGPGALVLLLNAGPWFVLVGPYGLLSSILAVAFWVAEAAWLVRVRHAISASGS